MIIEDPHLIGSDGGQMDYGIGLLELEQDVHHSP